MDQTEQERVQESIAATLSQMKARISVEAEIEKQRGQSVAWLEMRECTNRLQSLFDQYLEAVAEAEPHS